MVIKHAYSTTLRQWPTFSFLGGVPRFWRQIMAAEPRKLKSRRGQLAAPPRIYALSTTPNMAVGLDDGARIFGELGSWLDQRLRKVPPWGGGRENQEVAKKTAPEQRPPSKTGR